jgi:hypothetical protein
MSLRALWPSPGIVQTGLPIVQSQEHQGNTIEFWMHITKWVRLSTSHPSAGSNFVWVTPSWIRDIELQHIWMSSGGTWDIKLELNSSCTTLVDGNLHHWAKYWVRETLCRPAITTCFTLTFLGLHDDKLHHKPH